MTDQEILHKPFDLETHKKNFINYFEAVILKDGTVEYAVPSHTEYVYKTMIKNLNITREELFKMDCGTFDFYKAQTGLILCWSNHYDFLNRMPTDKQIITLAKLIQEGLTTNAKY